VDATAYIDAVSLSPAPFQQVNMFAETRYPVLTLAHGNWFQLNYWLNGVAVPGSLPGPGGADLSAFMFDPGVNDHREVAYYVWQNLLLFNFIIGAMPTR
jgi:hypothetical protein